MSPHEGDSKSWKAALRTFVVAFLVLNAVLGAVESYHQSTSVLVKIRPLQTLEDVGVLIAVAMTVTGLLQLHPLFGWWIGRLFGSSKPGFNVNLLPMFTRVLGPIYVVLLAFIVPQIAFVEEAIFRRGTNDWQDATVRSLLFGAIHMLVGVPVGAAIALAGVGMWLSYCYFQGGVDVSTVHHTTYDLIALSLVLVMVLFKRDELLAAFEGEEA